MCSGNHRLGVAGVRMDAAAGPEVSLSPYTLACLRWQWGVAARECRSRQASLLSMLPSGLSRCSTLGPHASRCRLVPSGKATATATATATTTATACQQRNPPPPLPAPPTLPANNAILRRCRFNVRIMTTHLCVRQQVPMAPDDVEYAADEEHPGALEQRLAWQEHTATAPWVMGGCAHCWEHPGVRVGACVAVVSGGAGWGGGVGGCWVEEEARHPGRVQTACAAEPPVGGGIQLTRLRPHHGHHRPQRRTPHNTAPAPCLPASCRRACCGRRQRPAQPRACGRRPAAPRPHCCAARRWPCEAARGRTCIYVGEWQFRKSDRGGGWGRGWFGVRWGVVAVRSSSRQGGPACYCCYCCRGGPGRVCDINKLDRASN